MLEGGEGCKIVQTGRVYSTSILSRREHLSAANGLSTLMHEFVSNATPGVTRVCTPSQLGGAISQKGAGSAVSSDMRAALLDTACVTSWTSETDDVAQVELMKRFSSTYHQSQYGQGVYVGQSLVIWPLFITTVCR